MRIRFSNKNRVIHYTRGMTDSDVINILEKRIAKRSLELEKRLWIVKQYESFSKAQENDKSWLSLFKSGSFTIESKVGDSHD